MGTEDPGIPDFLLDRDAGMHWEQVLEANPMAKAVGGLGGDLPIKCVCPIWELRISLAKAFPELDYLGCLPW